MRNENKQGDKGAGSAAARTWPWYAGSTRTSQMVALKAASLVARARPISVDPASPPLLSFFSSVSEHT